VGFWAGSEDCANNAKGEMVVRRQAKQAHAPTSAEVVRMSAPATVSVASVASGGTVGVAAHSLVITVRLRLLVRCLRMAVDASEAAEIRRNLVAVIAWRIRWLATVWNREPRVIEGSTKPTGGGVAGIAGGRERGSDVIGH
jgi:hypothetical protein